MRFHRDSRLIRITLITFFAFALLYALYEARGLLYGPAISIPSETITVHEPFTRIRGRAERISELRMNGKPISVTEDGAFEEPYLAAPGSNRIILEAIDSRGRATQETLDIVYVPAS